MPVLIIPGLYGSEPQHWQSLWEADIADARRVQQADWHNAERDAWLARLVEEVKRSPGAILVGHSLGATLIAHLAEQYPDLPVAGALLVAPADPDLRRLRVPGIASFAPLPLTPQQCGVLIRRLSANQGQYDNLMREIDVLRRSL